MKLELHSVDPHFETAYLDVRMEEGRLYTQEQILKLPLTSASDPNAAEWKRRAKSTRRFFDFAKRNGPLSCLDLGCGNGWMINKLLPLCSSVVGVDVNRRELEQAESIFEKVDKVRLIYGDIFSLELDTRFDVVLIYAAIQYFPDLDLLMKRIGDLLGNDGSLHILDSPFYDRSEVPAAKKRTEVYYTGRGKPEMAKYYYHHSWEALNKYNPLLHYDPSSFGSKLKNKISADSPFPWVEIKKQDIV